eukprot:scaffold4966_cov62-Phaeocystis_antarctica.AAC.4
MIGSLGLTASLLAIGASMQIKIAAGTPGVTAASIGVFAGIVGYMAFHALSYGPCAARRRAPTARHGHPLPAPRPGTCRAGPRSQDHVTPLTPPSQDHVARARRDLPVQHPRQGHGHRHDGQPRHLLRRRLHLPHHVRSLVERHLLLVRGLRGGVLLLLWPLRARDGGRAARGDRATLRRPQGPGQAQPRQPARDGGAIQVLVAGLV